MNHHQMLIASFADEVDLLNAVKAVRRSRCEIVDVFTPYCLHGLEELLDWRPSRLPIVCFLGGAFGAAVAVWMQFWTSATDWPLNVGGRPWNSLPAFVPVAFECMVLCAGFALVFAFLCRSRLYPGKSSGRNQPGLIDNRFVIRFRDNGIGMDGIERLLSEFHLISLSCEEESP